MTEILAPLPLPDGIRSRFIDGINGLRMHVLEAGHETPGRPMVVLLHGFPELAFSWRKVMPVLAAIRIKGWSGASSMKQSPLGSSISRSCPLSSSRSISSESSESGVGRTWSSISPSSSGAFAIENGHFFRGRTISRYCPALKVMCSPSGRSTNTLRVSWLK